MTTAVLWRETEARGTPIVEDVPDAGMARVTFVYRASPGVGAVSVVTLQNDQLANEGYYRLARMHNLSSTDVWFRSYRVPRNARIVYRVGPDPDRRTRAQLDDAAWQRKLAALQLDPREHTAR